MKFRNDVTGPVKTIMVKIPAVQQHTAPETPPRWLDVEPGEVVELPEKVGLLEGYRLTPVDSEGNTIPIEKIKPAAPAIAKQAMRPRFRRMLPGRIDRCKLPGGGF